jgi:hypothetical protein
MEQPVKIIVGVLVGLALALAGVIGFIVVSHESPPARSGPRLSGKSGEVTTIATGKEVDLRQWLQPGRQTLVEFSAAF